MPASTGIRGDHRVAQPKGEFAFRGIVGDSRAVRGAVEYTRRLAADAPKTVLLVGETGTGKGLLARGIHHAGTAGDAPFLSVDCGAARAAVLESELFGHEPGIFDGADTRRTGIFELAGEGTVYLEDIGRLPARLQPKLMRALEVRQVRRRGGLEPYDVRCTVVVSSSRPLEELVAEGSFREDLFHAVNAARVSLPPLRDREDDVVMLARHFVDEVVREEGLLPMELSEEAIETLRAYDWPGNVRELRSVVQRAAETCDGITIQARHLSIRTRRSAAMLEVAPPDAATPIAGAGYSLREIEIEAIRTTLLRTQGDRLRASRMLQIPVPELLRKVMEYDLEALVERSEAG